MPKSLPHDLIKSLRETLLLCGPFNSDHELRAIFADDRIALWRNIISDNTPNRAQRVASFIANLLNRRDTAGNNALARALQVLADHTTDHDHHEQLAALADEVASALAEEPTPDVPTGHDHTPLTPGASSLHIGGAIRDGTTPPTPSKKKKFFVMVVALVVIVVVIILVALSLHLPPVTTAPVTSPDLCGTHEVTDTQETAAPETIFPHRARRRTIPHSLF